MVQLSNKDMEARISDNKFLIQEILTGNQKAFQTFIETYQRLVSHVVFRIVSDETDREDICQDVFLKVYKNLPNFKFESKVSTWVAKIAYNTSLNYLEKKKIPLYKDLTAEGESLDSISGTAIAPDEYAEARDISQRIKLEIKKLPVHFRTIVTLFHLEGMSYREISGIMKLPEGTVKSYLFRARKILKERLLSKYQPEELCHTSI